MVQQGTRQTVAEFEAFIALPENRYRNFELIDGKIFEKMRGQSHMRIVTCISQQLVSYTITQPVRIVETNARYRKQDNPYNSFQPDISYFTNLYVSSMEKNADLPVPDLAIEIKSPDDMIRHMRYKAEYYMDSGSQLVWLILRNLHHVEVYSSRANDITTLTEQDTLDGGEVLPGFSLKVADIFVR